MDKSEPIAISKMYSDIYLSTILVNYFNLFLGCLFSLKKRNKLELFCDKKMYEILRHNSNQWLF